MDVDGFECIADFLKRFHRPYNFHPVVFKGYIVGAGFDSQLEYFIGVIFASSKPKKAHV